MEKSNLRMEMLKRFLADDPADDFSEYALALEFEKAGNSNESRKLLENLLTRNPEYLAAYYQLGKLLEKENAGSRAASVYLQGMEVAERQQDQKTLNELRTALDMLD
jgi:tetratricopeptide (TPR) repeat protein